MTAGVQHIIYLGGLADPRQKIAAHLRSRIETGQALRSGRVPVTEFRAGVIVGPGSISFEMIRFTTELFPLIPGPPWIGNCSQPIAVQNVLDYLTEALTNHAGQGQVFEIGGPQVMKYSALMLEYARLRGLKRRMITFPYIPLWFMAFGIGLTSPVPRRIAYALIDGLRSDSRVQEPSALQTFPDVRLLPYDTAVRGSLARLHPGSLQPVWKDSRDHSVNIRHEGFFISHRGLHVNAPPEKVFEVIARLGQDWGLAVCQRVVAPARRGGFPFSEARIQRKSARAGGVPAGRRPDGFLHRGGRRARRPAAAALDAQGSRRGVDGVERGAGAGRHPPDPDGLLHPAWPARLPLLVLVISRTRAGISRPDPRHCPQGR